MRVCVDLNGVLTDTTQAITNGLARWAGVSVPSRSFSKAMVGAVFPNTVRGDGPKVLTEALYRETLRRTFETVAYLDVPPMAEAREGVIALMRMGHEVVILSDASSVTKVRVKAWLQTHGFPNLDIVFTRKCRPKEPHQACCDIVIDNELLQLTPLLEYGKHAPQLVHFLPPEGAAGCDIARASRDPRIPSLRGWPAVLDHLYASVAVGQAA